MAHEVVATTVESPTVPNGAHDRRQRQTAPEREASEHNRHVESPPRPPIERPVVSSSSVNQAPLVPDSVSELPLPGCVTAPATVHSALTAEAEHSHPDPSPTTSSKTSLNALRRSSTKQSIATSQPSTSPIAEQAPYKTSPKTTGSRASPSAVARPGSEINMVFGQYAGLGHHRRTSSGPSQSYDPELTAKDRAKQKMAVKRFMYEHIERNWKWPWPYPDPKSSVNVYATPGIQPGHDRWKERDEWESDIDSDAEPKGAEAGRPFRFENPDGVGDAIKESILEHKRRRQKRLKEEMAWNEGLRCFVLRRDAWTGARKVSRSSPSSSSPKRRKTGSASSDSGSSKSPLPSPKSTPAHNKAAELGDSDWETDVEIPIPDPLLPPENYMRQTITPAAYSTIYDKVILQQLTPACPLNLADVTRSCVQGWKRDGEWPAKGSVPEPPSAAAKKKSRKLSVASLFGLERLSSKENGEVAAAAERGREKEKADKERKGSGGLLEVGPIRRGFHRLLSLGRDGKARRGSKESIEADGKEPRDVTDINLA